MEADIKKREFIQRTPYISEVKISFVQPFVLYGNGGAGKSALLSKSALQSLKVETDICFYMSLFSKTIYILSSQLHCEEDPLKMLLEITQRPLLQEWLSPAVPLLMVRYCGTTPNSTALGPLLKYYAALIFAP